MGGGSSSNRQTSNTTKNTTLDNSIDARKIGKGSVSDIKGSNNNISIQSLDNEVVEKALESNERVSGQALSANVENNKGAFSFAERTASSAFTMGQKVFGEAIESIEAINEKSYGFAKSALVDSSEKSNAAINSLSNAVERSQIGNAKSSQKTTVILAGIAAVTLVVLAVAWSVKS